MAARRRERCSSAAEMLHFASHGCQVVRDGLTSFSLMIILHSVYITCTLLDGRLSPGYGKTGRMAGTGQAAVSPFPGDIVPSRTVE